MKFRNPFKSPENTDINNTKPEKFRAVPQRTLRGISKLRKQILMYSMIIGGIIAGKAQQRPDHQNTYFYFPEVHAWTQNAASQADFDTPAERAEYIWRGSIAIRNALKTGHKDLVHIFPQLDTTYITNQITESGNLADDNQAYINLVNGGQMYGRTGAMHVLHVYGSDADGDAAGVEYQDKRFIALNMETVDTNVRTKAHEFAHTFNSALHANHSNALTNVPIDLFDLNGNLMNTTHRGTLGYPTAALRAEVFTANPNNSIGNPSFGGDGYVYYDYYNSNNVLVGYGRIAIADLDKATDSVSDRIAAAVATGDPGYAPQQLSVNPDDVAPQPTIIVENGKYKLTDGAEDETAGFNFDATHQFSAKIEYYAYLENNNVNNANLPLPPGYNGPGFTRAEMEAGIPKDFYDTNYPGQNIVFRRFNDDANALGTNSDVIAATPTQANCTNYTAYLDANGIVTIPEDAGNNGSTGDNLTFDSTPDTFDCSNVGPNTVTLEVTGDGGTDTCTYTVTVVDNIAPTLTTQNVAGFLDSNGNYTANPSDFVQTMNDACGIASVTLDNTNFDCNNLGGNPVEVTVTVTDNNGNQTTQSANLTLSDDIAPDAPANLTIDATTNTSVTVSSEPANDNCGVAHYEFYIDTIIDGVANGTSVDTNTAPNYTYTDLDTVNTQYEFYIKAVDGSGNVSNASTILGIEDRELAGLRLYPNPATNTLNIEIDGELDDIEIYNLQGQLVREFDPQGASKFPANISGLAKGVYIVDIWNKQGQKSVAKLVVK